MFCHSHPKPLLGTKAISGFANNWTIVRCAFPSQTDRSAIACWRFILAQHQRAVVSRRQEGRTTIVWITEKTPAISAGFGEEYYGRFEKNRTICAMTAIELFVCVDNISLHTLASFFQKNLQPYRS